MPLTMAGIGETNTISRIGGNEETRRFSGKSWICCRSGSCCTVEDRRQCDRKCQRLQSGSK